ncbi:MAG: multicopper oxidase domain-containing protein [Gemmatimonadaceae bacterium]
MHMIPRASMLVSAIVLVSLGAHAPVKSDPSERLTANDNRQSGGKLENGIFTIHLEAREGVWYPEGPNGKSVTAAGWAEEGKPLQNPGPLIRVPEGTEVRAIVHNALAAKMAVFGLGEKRGLADSAIIAAGETRELRFVASTPGTYYYGARTNPIHYFARLEDDSQLNGALVVDANGAKTDDRIFLISWWFTIDSLSPTGLGRGTMAINGLSWPHTERIDVTQGDSLHWRVINTTGSDHPMHLHGFYFRLDAKGNGVVDKQYAPADRRMEVTELMNPGETMLMTWSPNRPGNWIFHCHFAGHLSQLASLDNDAGKMDMADLMNHKSDRPHQMYGLVLGISVKPKGELAKSTETPRAMRLIVREVPDVFGKHPGYAFVLGGSPAEKQSDALPVPGPALILRKGQPVKITVVNQSHDHAAVHWHGVELVSYPDGVPGWSGFEKKILPAIAPGDSLTVTFTPPRAGTFMYHSHFNEFSQITSGLYGPIIVLEPGAKYNAEVDRTLMFSDAGPTQNVIRGPFPQTMLNGRTNPSAMDLKAGTKYRFRLINIKGDFAETIGLMQGDKPVAWRMVAKDGATLPASQAVMMPAMLHFAPGEIYDFEYTPSSAGELSLKFSLPDPNAPPGKPIVVAVHVH